MFIPPNSYISTSRENEKIAIIGAPGSGKTTASFTFPNRYWLDFDHKLPAEEQTAPFWNPQFCDSLAKRPFSGFPPNQRDAVSKWIKANISQFEAEQTVILDSYTNMIAGFALQENLENDMISEKERKWTFYRNLLRFQSDIMTAIKTSACRIVIIFHERAIRDTEGELTAKIAPLCEGQYKDAILKDFTDVWRQLCFPFKQDAKGNYEIMQGKKVVDPSYFWQIVSDDNFNANMNQILSVKVRAKGICRVRADYNEIIKLYKS